MRYWDWTDWCLCGVLGLCFLGVVWAGVVVVVAGRKPTFDLIKDQWGCTQSHKETRLAYFTKVGSVQVPHYTDEMVCDQWTRK